MELFHVVDDAFVILRTRGVYKQAKLYQRGKDYYAGVAGGYVRILRHNGTSNPNVSVVDFPEDLRP
jgi:hypothetical protein